jgi:hypothetical protein
MAILDFAKAFDKVPHSRLLRKLEHYGIRGSAQNWIKSFLTDRTQKVLVDGACSEEGKVTSGVPQGSVLGPTLFLIFINDISNQINSTMRLFADDCLLYREIKGPEDHNTLQRDLHTLYDWSRSWQMDFNVDKCYTMSVTLATKNRREVTYSMGGKSLTRTTTSPYLGVEISHNLKWSPHIDMICSKAHRVLGLFRRNLEPHISGHQGASI